MIVFGFCLRLFAFNQESMMFGSDGENIAEWCLTCKDLTVETVEQLIKAISKPRYR